MLLIPSHTNMKVLLFSLLFFGAAFAAYEDVEIPPLDGRIIGGDEASIVNYPYQVSVEYLSSHRCGGAIIARTWILTGAHCVDGLSDTSFRVRLGTSYRGVGGDILTVSNVIAHSNYSTTTFDFDIALLQLAEPISLSYNAQIVALPNEGAELIEGTLANVTGWGLTQVGGSPATVLQVIEIPIISDTVCRDLYSLYTVTGRMFCAGLYDGGKDACTGDGGGPLVSNSVLLGLSSWGVGCAQARYPGVYTNVGTLRDWITEQTGI